jgi:homoserine O-acetyltransferase/O-succinyltransferase
MNNETISSPSGGPTARPERFSLGDFTLENGTCIRGASLTYITHGNLNAKRDNAILLLPSLMADRHRHDSLIGSGLAFDPARHFIIAADTFGNGQASSPSNSSDQPGADFPAFSIRDMVRAQHRLVTGHLAIEQLLAVGGISMGGMQAYQWAVSYPRAMKGIVAAITMGRTTAWVSAIYEAMRKAIHADPSWEGGRYASQPKAGLRSAMDFFLVLTRHWGWYDAQFGSDNRSVVGWLQEQEDVLLGRWDANNFIAQTVAEDLHDIGHTPGMEGDYLRALKSIEAKVLLMPSQTDLLHPPDDSRQAVRHIPKARFIEIPSAIGHLGGAGALQTDIDFMNHHIARFVEELQAA